MSKIHDLLFGLKIGAKVVSIDKPVDEVVIRYKDKYISVLESEDGIEEFAWSHNATMFTVPIRDFWEATPPQEIEE